MIMKGKIGKVLVQYLDKNGKIIKEAENDRNTDNNR
jgi:hypothetical protein